MSRSQTRYLAGLLCLLFAFLSGCNSAKQASGEHDDHGHSHDHEHAGAPKSLPVAITELRKKWGEISKAMDSSDPDSAHQPLHDIGRVLEAVPDLAAETDLSENDWNEIKSEVDKLLDAFGDIDSAFHKEDGDKATAYEAAKSTIDEGIAALEAKLPLLSEGASTNDHDTDHNHRDREHDHDNKNPAADE